MKIVKSTTVAAATLVAVLFSGCAQMNALAGIPNNKEEMYQYAAKHHFQDKEMLDAYAVLWDEKANRNDKGANDVLENRPTDIRKIKNNIIDLNLYRFVAIRDGITSSMYANLYVSRVESTRAVQIFLDVAKKRGNHVKAYKGDINIPILYGNTNILPAETNGVRYDMMASPAYIEFDKNNKIISIIVHTEHRQTHSDLPDSELLIHLNYYVLTGPAAASKQALLPQKKLEDSFLYDLF
jgi:hypothetical protein